MPKLSKKLSKKKSGMASARQTRHGRQRPPPLPSPIPESNYSTAATTPSDSSFTTPASTPAPEIAFGDVKLMDEWQSDLEDLLEILTLMAKMMMWGTILMVCWRRC